MRNVLALILISAFHTVFADTLSLPAAIDMALAKHPLEGQKLLHASMGSLEQYISGNLLRPSLSLNGQYTYQSDVVGFPDNPVISVDIPKNQSRLYAEVQQVIYNGGISSRRQGINAAEVRKRDLEVEVQLQKTREGISELYFAVLLNERKLDVLRISLLDLERQVDNLRSRIDHGVVLSTVADRFELEALKLRSEIRAIESDIHKLRALLGSWTGTDISQVILVVPVISPRDDRGDRPEIRLVDAGIAQLSLVNELDRSSRQPKLALFLQAGMGSPNPLNFFETDFKGYYIGGLRAVWTPFDHGDSRSRIRINELQADRLRLQRQLLTDNFERESASVSQDTQKFAELESLARSSIAMQERIVSVSASQHGNGVITTAEYLAEVDKLNRLRIQADLHAILGAKTQWDKQLINGNIQ